MQATLTTTELAKKLGLSDRTIRDWCMRDPGLAAKRDGVWFVNIHKLAEIRGVDLVELLLILRSPTTKLVKASQLSRDSGIPRRTIAHWCKTREGFATRVGLVWYVNLEKLGVTLLEIAARRRDEQSDADEEA